jgi:hypothetical protein
MKSAVSKTTKVLCVQTSHIAREVHASMTKLLGKKVAGAANISGTEIKPISALKDAPPGKLLYRFPPS